MRGVLFGIGSALAWSLYTLINRYAYSNYDLHTFSYTTSVLVAAALFAGTNYLLKVLLQEEVNFDFLKANKNWVLILNGLLASLAATIFIVGQGSTSSTNAAFLITGVMATTSLIAWIFKVDSINTKQVVWFVSLFAGLYVAIVGFELLTFNSGDLIIITCLPIFGCVNVLAKSLTNKFSSEQITFVRFVAGGIALVLLSPITNARPSGTNLGYAALAGFMFWLSIIFLYKAIKMLGPSLAIVLNKCTLPYVMFGAYFFLKEQITGLDIFGAIIVTLSVFMLVREKSLKREVKGLKQI